MASNGISPWATAAIQKLSASIEESLHHFSIAGFDFDIKLMGDSLWIIAHFDHNQHIAFRAAYSPDGFNDIKIENIDDKTLNVRLAATIGEYNVAINLPVTDKPILHYVATLKPLNNLSVPFWPRDIIVYGNSQMAGEIHVSQIGTRSGLLYGSFKKPANGTFMYLQNLTALNTYYIDTETSAADTVGGQWPELGLSLPPALDKPMQKDKKYTVSDAYIYFSKQSPANQFDISKGFLEALGNLYLLLPRPESIYRNYLETLPKALHDLETNKGCWAHRSGHPYLNAYLCDYETPPEIMVQLAVLLPVRDYMRWSGENCNITNEISNGLKAFYSEKIGTVMRWLPSEVDKLDESEEQKKPLVMDAWYLHHPLLNLARMALNGDEIAKELLLNSVDYAIRVAHHFKYCWPVFYKMDTLEVVKAETKPGEGGEKDVAGLYAHVMLQVWELTKEQKYFDEAEKAAQSMVQHGFNVLYQANNTMFSAKAMMYLYRETKTELYRDLSYLFLANIFKNVALWECEYGFGKNFPTFFELFPLSDAPYTAVFEEQESYTAVHEFLNYANGIDLLPSVRLLLAEFVRYAVHRMMLYYPPTLPEDMLCKKPKTGELDPQLWVALEDIHDGWEQSGSVGQEVYGAGLAFGIVPRQYMRVPGHDFLIYIDYPVLNQTIKGNTMRFDVSGDSRLTCRMKIINRGEDKLPVFKITAGNQDDQKHIDSVDQRADDFEYTIHGNQAISISW